MNSMFADTSTPSSGVPLASEIDGTGTPEISTVTRLTRVALRRKWAIIGAVLVCLVVGLVVTLLATPLYTATTRIEVAREGARITEFRGVEREAPGIDLEFYQTQYGLLKSQSLAEQVARTLRLADDPKFFALFGVDQEALNTRSGGAVTADKKVRLAAEILVENVTIDPDRGSRLIRINFTSPDPILSARIANAWAQSFIQSNLTRRFDATSYARSFLENRLAQLRVKLEESERKLVAYAAEASIINLPGSIDPETGRTTGERSLAADELARLSEELAVATSARIQAQSQMQRAGGGSSQLALENGALNQLRQRRAELAGDYAKLMAQFEPEYPPAKSIASQIASLDRAITREEGRVGQSFSQAFAASQARENALRERVNTLKASLTDLRGRTIQYNIYQRDVETNRQLYDGLLQRYKEIGVAGGVGTNNVSVVDPAQVPPGPSHPKLLLNLLFALLAGMALGTALAWLLEELEEGITDPTQVPALFQLPLLGTVPTSKEDNPLVSLENPRSPMVEAYLAIQANLALSTDHGVPRSIAVTSTRPREGKSLTAYALAHSLARANRKVVLIDCDLRAPMVHNEFNLPNDVGVSNFLAGSDSYTGALHKVAESNLTIMTAGPPPPNAANLLTGDRLRELIGRLLETHDHVIVDAPPVMGLADAPLIASAVEGTIYSVETRVVRANLARIALNRLRSSNANLLGIVLTKFDVKHSSYGYGYDYGYGYGRGK